MAQPQPPSYMAYDRTIVVFSPDGRLLQVEYARQMVKNGSTSIGLVTSDAVILGVVKPSAPLMVSESSKKIFEIDDHIAMVSSGSLADARSLAEMARVKAQINRVTYNEPISVSTLSKHICDKKHIVTQYAGVRPYGVGLLIGGVDETGPKLYETEPSGTMIEWKAQSIGRGVDKAKKILTTEYREGMTETEGSKLVVKALKSAEKDAENDSIEIVVVKRSGIKFTSGKAIGE
jgi:proteasome alpha subunit